LGVFELRELPLSNDRRRSTSCAHPPRSLSAPTRSCQTIANKQNLESPAPEFRESLRTIQSDARRTYDYLLRVSMIASLRRAAELG